jgi:hypothetical protein
LARTQGEEAVVLTKENLTVIGKLVADGIKYRDAKGIKVRDEEIAAVFTGMMVIGSTFFGMNVHEVCDLLEP